MVKLGEDHDCVWRDRAIGVMEVCERQNEVNGGLRLTIERQAETIERQAETIESQAETIERQSGIITAYEGQLAGHNERLVALESEVACLKRKQFGQSSEKLPPVAKELRDRGEIKTDPEKTQKKRRKNRETKGRLKEREVRHKVAQDERSCPECGGELEKVGEGKISIVYEYIPASIERQRHTRETLACPLGHHVVTAPGPVKVLDKITFGPGLLSQLIVAKCADAIPLYRQEKQFKRLGIPMARSTLCRLYQESAELLRPIYNRIVELIAKQEIVQADETPIRVQSKKNKAGKGCQRGYFWTFLPAAALTLKLICYVFSPSRSGQTPSKILGASNGTLVVDAYTGYNEVTKPEGRKRGGCMAHARRKFFEARDYAPEESNKALQLIRAAYLVEHQAREQDLVGTKRHLELRQSRSAEVMAELKAFLEGEEGRHLPKGPFGQALSYALNQWDPLTLFLSDARIPIDNNMAENKLRPLALGRKNFLFVGNEASGDRHAILATLIASCEANEINPQQYLADVLMRVSSHPFSRLDELLPNHWIPPPDPG